MTNRDTAFVKGIEGDYLECRTIRHAWDIEHLGMAADLLDAADIPYGYRGAMIRVLECTRCGMQRHDFLTGLSRRPARLADMGDFVVYARRYRQPKGYLWDGSTELDRPINADYQRELFARAGSPARTSTPLEATA